MNLCPWSQFPVLCLKRLCLYAFVLRLVVAKYVAIRCHAFLYVHICISSHNADRRIVRIMAAYSGYQKNCKNLTALQAVGFGVEQGFKESVKVGFGMVEQRHVSTFLLSGDVRVKIGSTFVQTTTHQSITMTWWHASFSQTGLSTVWFRSN